MVYASIRLGGESLVIGRGSISWLAQVKGRQAVVVASRSMQRNGYYEKAVSLLEAAGLKTKGYFNYGLNPTFDEALHGAKFLKEISPDWVIAIGGGTVMDLAKLMWVLYENVSIGSIEALQAEMDGLEMGKKAKFVCIPSTSGSASEVSKSSVITNNENKRKVPIRNLGMVPTYAILDPEITLSLPKSITAETGMDALTHHLESLVSNNANPISDAIASSGAVDAIKWLPIAFNDGSNIEAREKMMFCSTMGGLAFSSSSLGLAHGVAHAIGARLNVPHGLLNAILLPRVIRINTANEKARSKYLSVAQHFGQDDLSQIIIRLRDLLGLPSVMQEIINNDGFFEDNLSTMVQDVLDDGLTKLNCVQPSRSQILDLLKDVYYGSSAIGLDGDLK